MTNTTLTANAAQTPMGQGAEVATAAPTTHPCACGGVTFRSFGKDEVRTCRATTKRTFAPGHDAKLKGELIRRELAGDVVVLASGEVVSPTYYASRFGFADMVQDGVRRGIAKAQAKAAKKAAKGQTAKVVKSEDEAAKADELVVKAKVGRWEYFGIVLAAGDGQPVFRYTDKKGNTQDTMKFARV